MKMSILKLISAGVFAIAIFTGCGSSLSSVKPSKIEKNVTTIKADVEAAMMGFINIGRVTRDNYKYAFAMAATETKNKGYESFSITYPHRLVGLYREKNVKNFEEAYNVCDKGKGSFSASFSVYKMASNVRIIQESTCDNMLHTINTIAGDRASVTLVIRYSNIDSMENNVTFNADDVLSSSLLEGLDKSNFE